MSPETAQLFSAALGATPEFWMNVQSAAGLGIHCIKILIKPPLGAG